MISSRKVTFLLNLARQDIDLVRRQQSSHMLFSARFDIWQRLIPFLEVTRWNRGLRALRHRDH